MIRQGLNTAAQDQKLRIVHPHARLFHHESVSAKDRGDPGERGVIFHRWGRHLANDPYYHPLLTLGKEDYSLDGVADGS